MTTPDWTDGIDSNGEQSPSLHVQSIPNPPTRFTLAVAAALLSPLLIDVPIAALMRAGLGRDEPGVVFQLVFYCVTGAKFCLLAVWLAWGSSRTIWRVIVVFVSLLFTCLAFAYDAHATEGYSVVLLACVAISGICAIPKLLGIRWVNEDDLGTEARADAPGHMARQFTLVDLFIWTATVAVVTGVIRWLGFPRDLLQMNPLEMLLVFGCGLGYPAAGTLLSMWAALAPGPNVGNRCGLAWLAMIGLLSPFLLMMAGGEGHQAGAAILTVIGVMSASMFLVFAPLLMLRSWGDRLVRLAKSSVVQMPRGG